MSRLVGILAAAVLFPMPAQAFSTRTVVGYNQYSHTVRDVMPTSIFHQTLNSDICLESMAINVLTSAYGNLCYSVYSSATVGGPYTQDLTGCSTGEVYIGPGWASSDVIDFRLRSGRYYAFAFTVPGWTFTYAEGYGPTTVPFGTYYGQDLNVPAPGSSTISLNPRSTGFVVYASYNTRTTQDSDGDGHVAACLGGDDCDDRRPSIYPGAPESCNGIDEDCDGDLVDGFPNFDGDAEPDCFDADDDNDRDNDALDCDDNDPTTYTGAPELCDLRDNSCDGQVDEGFPDHEGDGLNDCTDPDDDNDGDPDTTDCAPFDAAKGANAVEVCDAIDQDCDGAADDGLARTDWYADADGDGYGTGSAQPNCAQPEGTSATPGDCADSDATTHPNATDSCDTVDQDCDGDKAEGFPDSDVDGLLDCVDLNDDNDASPDVLDCAPLDPAVYPTLREHCDGKDENCNGLIDDNPFEGVNAFEDQDLDGFGNPNAPTRVCALEPGAVEDNTDCDDGDATAYPGADEVWYDDIDQACDGGSDYDQDGDGFDLGEDDCNDEDPAIYVGAPELPDGLDNDCDGAAEDNDADGDGNLDDDGDGFDEAGGDCDDADPTVAPGVPEVCDDVDQDCDGDVDGETCPSCGCGTGVPSSTWFAILTLSAVVLRRRTIYPAAWAAQTTKTHRP